MAVRLAGFLRVQVYVCTISRTLRVQVYVCTMSRISVVQVYGCRISRVSVCTGIQYRHLIPAPIDRTSASA